MKRACVLLAGMAIFGLSCLPPDETPIDDAAGTLEVGEQVSAATPEGSGCHRGTFECTDGPDATECGSWSFDVNEAGAISGSGQIAYLPGGPVQVELSGVIDPGTDSFQVVLITPAGGSGSIDLSCDGPTLNLTGGWSFTDGPEPTGNLVSGGVTGTSCVQLQ